MNTEPFEFTIQQAIDDCLDIHTHKTESSYDVRRQNEDKELLEQFIKRLRVYNLLRIDAK